MPLHNPISESQIPQPIARDSEVIEVLKAHEAAANPHPIYLSEAEGDARYRLSAAEIIISGTVNSTAGDTGVLHGITGIIVGIYCTVWDTARNWRVPPGFVNTTYDYFVYTTSTHFVIYSRLQVYEVH